MVGGLAIVVGFVLTLLLAVLLLTPTVDLTRFKTPIEELLTAEVGASVSIQKLRLTISLWPTARLEGLRISKIDAAGSTEIGRIDALEVKAGVLGLLRHEIAIKRLGANGVMLHAAPLIELARNLPAASESPYEVTAIDEFELRSTRVLLQDQEVTQPWMVIEQLNGGISRSRPLELEGSGRIKEVHFELSAQGTMLPGEEATGGRLPLSAQVELGDSRLDIQGSLDPENTDFAVKAALEWAGTDWREPFSIIDLSPPDIGPFQLSTTLTVTSATVVLQQLEALFGATDLRGDLQLDLAEDRPRLSGSLTSHQADLSPWTDESTRPLRDATRDMPKPDFDQEIPLEWLDSLDLDLELQIDEITGLPVSVEDVSAHPTLDRHGFASSLEMLYAGAKLDGSLELQDDGAITTLGIDLSIARLDLEEIKRWTAVKEPINGKVGRLHLTSTSRGRTIRELLYGTVGQLQVGDTTIALENPEQDRQVEYKVHRLVLGLLPDHRFSALMQSTVIGKDLRLEIDGRSPADWSLQRPWQARIALQGPSSHALFEGELTPLLESPTVDMSFLAEGDPLGDMSELLGVSDDADFPFHFAGRIQFDGEHRLIRLDSGRIGENELTARIERLSSEPDDPLQIDLDFSLLIPGQLAQLGEAISATPLGEGAVVDVPALPTGVYLRAADIGLSIERMVRKPTDITSVDAQFIIRDGKLEKAPFQFRLDQAKFRGDLSLDLRGEIPSAEVDIEAEKVDLGDLLELDRLIEGLTASVDSLQLEASVSGRTLRGMILREASYKATATGIVLEIPGIDPESTIDIEIESADVVAPAGQAAELVAVGYLEEAPIQVQLIGQPPDDEFTRLPFSLIATGAELRLEADGHVPLPLSFAGTKFSFTLTGPGFDAFNTVTGYGFPPLGPIVFKGGLALEKRLFALDPLHIQAGESDLEGKIILDLRERVPRFEVDLTSKRLKLDEYLAFELGSLLADDPTAPDDPETKVATDLKKLDLGITKSVKKNFDFETLHRANGFLTLRIEEVGWADQVSQGVVIEGLLDDGYLTIGPASLDLTQGLLEARFDLLILEDEVDAQFDLRVENLEYGPIVEVLAPEEAGDGMLSLDLGLRSQFASFQDVMADADGHIDFTLAPEHISSRMLDLWASGLFTSIFSVVNPGSESRVNCIVVRSNLADEQLLLEEFILDTTRIRARGEGVLELDDLTIDVKLTPRPKRRSFINLATPARITGPVQDPSVSLQAGGIARTAFRLYLWFITIYRELLRKPLPADGSDICLPPPRRTLAVDQP